MRHEKIAVTDRLDSVDIAAVWPASAQIAPVPIPDIEPDRPQHAFLPTPAAPDIPAGVGMMIVAAYVALISAFAAATIRSADSVFLLVIIAFFVGMFFTVPRLFFAVEPRAGRRASFDRFMHQGIDTFTGHCSGGAALVQMLIVPVLLTFGVIAMGIAIAVVS
jgi:hypothetical protein